MSIVHSLKGLLTFTCPWFGLLFPSLLTGGSPISCVKHSTQAGTQLANWMTPANSCHRRLGTGTCSRPPPCVHKESIMTWDLGGPTGVRHLGSYLDFFAGKVSLFLDDGAWVTALSSLLLLQLIAPGNLSLPTEQLTYQFLNSECQ